MFSFRQNNTFNFLKYYLFVILFVNFWISEKIRRAKLNAQISYCNCNNKIEWNLPLLWILIILMIYYSCVTIMQLKNSAPLNLDSWLRLCIWQCIFRFICLFGTYYRCNRKLISPFETFWTCIGWFRTWHHCSKI